MNYCTPRPDCLKKERDGERGREEMEGEGRKKEAEIEREFWALLLLFFQSNGILCSWMFRCHDNSNLVTSLFLPNPALKLWLLHPFAWLP